MNKRQKKRPTLGPNLQAMNRDLEEMVAFKQTLLDWMNGLLEAIPNPKPGSYAAELLKIKKGKYIDKSLSRLKTMLKEEQNGPQKDSSDHLE